MFSKKKSGKFILVVLVVMLVGGSIGFGAYALKKYQDVKKNPGSVVANNNKVLLDKLGKILQLPTGEDPQIASVSDKSKLGSDPFFRDVENNDYLIVYTKARRIIVYRESANKVINQGPFTINTQGKVKVTIVNASATTAAVGRAQKAITDKLGTDLGTVDTAGTAKNRDYKKNQVIDLTGGQRAAEAKKIADAIGGEIKATIPAGETTPQDTEVMVIVVQ